MAIRAMEVCNTGKPARVLLISVLLTMLYVYPVVPLSSEFNVVPLYEICLFHLFLSVLGVQFYIA